MFIRSANNMRRNRDYAHVAQGESLTLQSEEKASNINNIFDRILKTGMIPHRDVQALVGDFSAYGRLSYQDMKDRVLAGLDAFMTMPAKIRERFGNDPQKWLTFMDDPGNVDEAVLLGLLERTKVEKQDDK